MAFSRHNFLPFLSHIILGWGAWEPWTKCSVTCGQGPQTRRRRCLDEFKIEAKPLSPCKGENQQIEKRMCDQGACGSCDVAMGTNARKKSDETDETYGKKSVKRRERRRRRRGRRRRGRGRSRRRRRRQRN